MTNKYRTTIRRSGCVPESCFVLNGHRRPVGLDGSNSGRTSARGFVHLAGANDLMVAGLEIEIELAVLRIPAVVMGINFAVGTYGGDAVLGRFVGGVQLAGKNNL